MALQTTDLFIVERSGVQYQMTANQIADFVGAVRDFTAVDIAGRNALTDVKVGDRVFVTDATADANVDSGWAIYRLSSESPNVYEKIQEQESMDIAVSAVTNLGTTITAASITITNDTGSNAIIPLADGTNAGLMSPSAFSAIHNPASSGLTSGTNPVVVNGGTQEVTFNITQLDPLP